MVKTVNLCRIERDWGWSPNEVAWLASVKE